MLESAIGSGLQLASKFEHFLKKAFVSLFKEFLGKKAKNLSDHLNSSKYLLKEGEEELDKSVFKLFTIIENLTKQWKRQLSKDNFVTFMKHLAEMFSYYFLENLKNKKVSILGSIKLEKEVKKIINYFGELSETNVRTAFGDLLVVVRVLGCHDREQVEAAVVNYEGRMKKTDFLLLFENKVNN